MSHFSVFSLRAHYLLSGNRFRHKDSPRTIRRPEGPQPFSSVLPGLLASPFHTSSPDNACGQGDTPVFSLPLSLSRSPQAKLMSTHGSSPGDAFTHCGFSQLWDYSEKFFPPWKWQAPWLQGLERSEGVGTPRRAGMIPGSLVHSALPTGSSGSGLVSSHSILPPAQLFYFQSRKKGDLYVA